MQVATVFRVRWQVELMFKSFKSIGEINITCRSNPNRILCEVYAKLLTQLKDTIMVAWMEMYKIRYHQSSRTYCTPCPDTHDKFS